MPEVTIELKGKSETWQLNRGTQVIGRSRSADIRIAHPSISGRHARIEVAEDGSLKLVDAGSRHGMLLGDVRVSEVAVADGLAVRIGKATLHFKTGGGQARAECLQRLQLPDPGVSGISPPPAPGSGLGPTPSDSIELEPVHIPSAASGPGPLFPGPIQSSTRRPGILRQLADGGMAAGSIAISLGVHAFIALVLSVVVYRQVAEPPDRPVQLTIRPAKALFEPPKKLLEGDGRGSPLADTEIPSRQEIAKSAPQEPEVEPALADASDLNNAPGYSDIRSTRPAAAIPPSQGLSRRNAMRRITVKKVEYVPDDGTWEAKQKPVVAAAGTPKVKEPLDIQPGDDPIELVRGNMDKGREGGWKTIAMMEPGEVVVVTGQYDHVQRLLDRLKVRYTLVEERRLGGAKLSQVRVLFLNCPAQLDGAGIEKLRNYVAKGGWVISTDWSLSAIREAFPGYLQNVTLSPETWVRIEGCETAKDDPLLQDVFNFKGENPKWYLEERSYLFKVSDKEKDKVTVLIESAEMKKKWGTGTVAVVFTHGRGRVLHIVSHLQQVSTDPKSHYAMYQLMANFLIQAALLDKGAADK